MYIFFTGAALDGVDEVVGILWKELPYGPALFRKKILQIGCVNTVLLFDLDFCVLPNAILMRVSLRFLFLL